MHRRKKKQKYKNLSREQLFAKFFKHLLINSPLTLDEIKIIEQIFLTVVVEVKVAQENYQVLPFPSNSLKSLIPLRKIMMIKKV